MRDSGHRYSSQDRQTTYGQQAYEYAVSQILSLALGAGQFIRESKLATVFVPGYDDKNIYGRCLEAAENARNGA